jgi:hypothetical protein
VAKSRRQVACDPMAGFLAWKPSRRSFLEDRPDCTGLSGPCRVA